MAVRTSPEVPTQKNAFTVDLNVSPDVLLIESEPTQLPADYIREAENSREVIEDFQRGSIVHRWNIIGRPDRVWKSSFYDTFKPGRPHPWYTKNGSTAYVVSAELRHGQPGEEMETDGTRKFTVGVTIATVVYATRVCPHTYERTESVALQTVPEWFTREVRGAEGQIELGAVRIADNAVPFVVGRPVPIVTLRWPRVALDEEARAKVRKNIGRIIDTTFEGESPGYWLLTNAQMKHLHGAFGSSEWHEVVLTLKGDPWRKHRYYKPLLARGLNVAKNPEDSRATYDSLHRIRDIYPVMGPDATILGPSVGWTEMIEAVIEDSPETRDERCRRPSADTSEVTK